MKTSTKVNFIVWLWVVMMIVAILILAGCSDHYYAKDTRKHPGPKLVIKRHKAVKRYEFFHPKKLYTVKNKKVIKL